MEKNKEKNSFDQLFAGEDEDISESIDYIKRTFGSIMDVIFGEDDFQDNNCNNCRKKLV